MWISFIIKLSRNLILLTKFESNKTQKNLKRNIISLKRKIRNPFLKISFILIIIKPKKDSNHSISIQKIINKKVIKLRKKNNPKFE